jgi:hypothetical protein
MGRLKAFGIPLLAVLGFGLSIGASPAAAQNKTARGTATTVSDSSLTVKVGDKDMTFGIDAKTVITAKGAGTKTRKEGGVKLTDFVKTGGAVLVTYREAAGAMTAVSVQPIASAGNPSAEGPETKIAAGTVKSVSDTSLTVTSGGKDMMFAVTSATKVQAKGAGTATKEAGGKIAFSALVGNGDTVSVSYTEAGTKMTATEVRITVKNR